MKIEITADVERFAHRARPFLAARIERNVMATITELLAREGTPQGSGQPLFAIGSDAASGAVLAAALRTPPRNMVANGFSEPAAAAALIAAWHEHDPEVAGISAAPADAAVLTAAWRQHTGGRTEPQFSEALHELDAVLLPERQPAGVFRRATPADEQLLLEWAPAFCEESGFGDPATIDSNTRRTLAAGRYYVWDDDGPVAMSGHAPRIAGVSRVGPVYTPPEHRGRGYASSLVAELSQKLLDDGAKRCILFTDLANPTSNKIYAAVGYRRVSAWEEHRFLPDSAS